jgi:hypothetical protein
VSFAINPTTDDNSLHWTLLCTTGDHGDRRIESGGVVAVRRARTAVAHGARSKDNRIGFAVA